MKQRTACLKRGHAPPLHLESVLEPETRRIHQQRQIQIRTLMMDDKVMMKLLDDHMLTGRSKHKLKVCYWTEGVSFEKTTTESGHTLIAAALMKGGELNTNAPPPSTPLPPVSPPAFQETILDNRLISLDGFSGQPDPSKLLIW